jgi:hypothetical protein
MLASFQGLEVSTPANNTLAQLEVEPPIVQPDMPVLETFTIFANLPLELRRLIWGNSLPGPRVIEIFSNSEDRRNPNIRCIRPDTHAPLFAIGRACKESEEVVLKEYSKSTADTWLLDGLPSNSAILFNYQRDIVHLTGRYTTRKFLSSAPESILECMTAIGFNPYGFWSAMKEYDVFGPALRQCTTLSGLFRMSHLQKIIVQPDHEICLIRGAAPFEIVDCRNRLPCFRTLKTIRNFKLMVQRDDYFGCLRAVDVEIGSYVRSSQADGDECCSQEMRVRGYDCYRRVERE